MATAKNTPAKKNQTPVDPFASIGVASMAGTAAGDNVKSGPKFVVIGGMGYTDVVAIDKVLTVIRDNFPDATITNQNRKGWTDELILQRAKALGLGTETAIPEFIRMQQSGELPKGRVSEEMYAEKGYKQLNTLLAAECEQLHIFGDLQGPQRGYVEAFSAVEKPIRRWGIATDTAGIES